MTCAGDTRQCVAQCQTSDLLAQFAGGEEQRCSCRLAGRPHVRVATFTVRLSMCASWRPAAMEAHAQAASAVWQGK